MLPILTRLAATGRTMIMLLFDRFPAVAGPIQRGSILVRSGDVDGVFSGAQPALWRARQGVFGVSILLIETASAE